MKQPEAPLPYTLLPNGRFSLRYPAFLLHHIAREKRVFLYENGCIDQERRTRVST